LSITVTLVKDKQDEKEKKLSITVTLVKDEQYKEENTVYYRYVGKRGTIQGRKYCLLPLRG